MTIQTQPPPLQVTATCEARTGYRASEFGNEPLWCNQTRGLRSFIDAQGFVRYYCAVPEHERSVRRRFGSDEAQRTAAVAAEGEAIYRSLMEENAYFRAHENDDESVWCADESHAPGCPCRAGGDPELIVQTGQGYMVTAEWSD